jgi:hypothetical protein
VVLFYYYNGLLGDKIMSYRERFEYSDLKDYQELEEEEKMLAEESDGERAFRIANIILKLKVIKPICTTCHKSILNLENPQLETDARGLRIIGYKLKQRVYYVCHLGHENDLNDLLAQRK